MRRFQSNNRKKAALPLAVMMAVFAPHALAEGQQLGDDELGEVWGQAMFSVENRSADFDFTRITLNADIKLNANFSNIKAGGASLSDPSIDIGTLNFVDNGQTDAALKKSYVNLVDPYIELVYDKSADLANREIIGARIGFRGMTGNMGALINRLRGNVTISDGMGGAGAGTLTLTQAADATSTTAGMSTQFSCTNIGNNGCGADGKIAMSQINGLQANGATDFFISLLSKNVDSFGDGTSNKAPAGVSVNWMQGLSYNAMGVTPAGASLPAIGVRRQGG